MNRPCLSRLLLLALVSLLPLSSQAAHAKRPLPENISLLPASVELQIGQTQRLLVSAQFPDLAFADLTTSAVFATS